MQEQVFGVATAIVAIAVPALAGINPRHSGSPPSFGFAVEAGRPTRSVPVKGFVSK